LSVVLVLDKAGLPRLVVHHWLVQVFDFFLAVDLVSVVFFGAVGLLPAAENGGHDSDDEED